MILRIVKLPIPTENHEAFFTLFNEINTSIAAFEGCLEVNAYPDHTGNFCFTVSKWQSQEHLEGYRTSPFFERTWKLTKKLFNGKAEAWSLMS